MNDNEFWAVVDATWSEQEQEILSLALSGPGSDVDRTTRDMS